MSHMSLRDMRSYGAVKKISSMGWQYWGNTEICGCLYENSSFWAKFVRLLTAYEIISFHQSKQQNWTNSKRWWTRSWAYNREREIVRAFLDPYLYVLVGASAHLYMCVHVFMYVLRGSPYSTCGESHLHSAPLPVANGIHLCQTAAWWEGAR